MKNKILLALFGIFIQLNANAQSAPIWTQTINSAPDSSHVFPVSTKTDVDGNIYVLCNESGPVGIDYKIHLKKYDTNGNLIWGLIFDNGGIDEPRGFDMELDSSGEIYIAGGLMVNTQPLLLKFSASGILIWQLNSIVAIQNDWLNKIIYKNGRIYLQSSIAVALLDLNGTELWSIANSVSCMEVDNLGRMVTSLYSPYETIVRYNLDGTISFQDSSVVASKIAIDQDNNITLMTSNNIYEIAHYDSGGAFMWIIDSLPLTPPFGDYTLDLIADFNNDIIAIGLNDTMYKFDSDGNQLWKKSMGGLDTYNISAKIILQNVLLLAGTVSGFGGYDIKIATYDLLGNESWYGMYSSNITQEFEVDLAFDIYSSSMYVLEDSISNSTLMKFEFAQFPSPIDFSLICVDSVWYDTINPNYINITVFNGNIQHLNYPSIQMISPMGDTISNPNNSFDFFAHLGNFYQTYTDTIVQLGITDFSSYTFVMSDALQDTSAQIGFCLTNGIADESENHFGVYPNPATGMVHIMDLPSGVKFDLQIFDTRGRCCYTSKVDDNNSVIDLEGLSSGLYILRLSNKAGIRYGKVIVQ